MRMMSPILYSPFSSWAWYFLERRTVLPITGWVKRRSTLTTTVLAFLSLTTTPCSTRFGIRLFPSAGGSGLAALFRQNRFDAGDRPADDAHAVCLFELAVGALEAEVER